MTNIWPRNKQYPNVEAERTETPPEEYREVAISRDARGNYFASFSYRVEKQEHQTGQVVAFDLGIKILATGVNEQGRISQKRRGHEGFLSHPGAAIKYN